MAIRIITTGRALQALRIVRTAGVQVTVLCATVKFPVKIFHPQPALQSSEKEMVSLSYCQHRPLNKHMGALHLWPLL